MKTLVVMMILAGTGAFAGSAAAQSRPEAELQKLCAPMRDKVGCRCALNNGGFIRGVEWRYNGPTRAAFEQCMLAQGRRG